MSLPPLGGADDTAVLLNVPLSYLAENWVRNRGHVQLRRPQRQHETRQFKATFPGVEKKYLKGEGSLTINVLSSVN